MHMADFHFLRPLWLVGIIPLIGICILVWRQRSKLNSWEEVCDLNLLRHLEQKKTGSRWSQAFLAGLLLFLSALFMILALAGPAWYKFPVHAYKMVKPRVLILDMSSDMLQSDLSPNRLSRAKFKLHDLLSQKDIGQLGLIAYTGEPFVIAPLTDDGLTIASLLSTLTPDIMPVAGNKLDLALNEARQLLTTAGYHTGQILVLTASSPSAEALEVVQKLADEGISSSIMPMLAAKNLNPLFKEFANKGAGQLLTYSPDAEDLKPWLRRGLREHFVLNKQDDIPLWRDEGRWFLIPALIFLLPAFRRGWLQKVLV
jgi:Ca-activated chloride channel family protein